VNPANWTLPLRGRCIAALFAYLPVADVHANDCTWQGHHSFPHLVTEIIVTIASIESGVDGLWKPVTVGEVPVVDTGWDCDSGVDLFEFPGGNPLQTNKATIGDAMPGVVAIQPLSAIFLDELTISGSSGVVIADAALLTFRGSALANQGKIEIGALSDLLDSARRFTGTTSLTGGGMVTLVPGTNPNIDGTGMLINQDNLINGVGNISVDLNNQSLVFAQDPGLLILSNVTRNSGSLKALGSGTLRLQGTTIDNSGGTISAVTGGRVELQDVTIQDGTLSTDNAGIIETIAPSVLDGIGLTISGTLLSTSITTLKGSITNSGNYRVANDHSTTLIGTLTNTGSLTLDATAPAGQFGPRTELFLDGDVLLNGGGSVALSDFDSNRIASRIGQFNTLTNEDNVISGSGELGDNVTGIVNRGEIRSEGAVALIIDPRDALGFSNETSGVLTAIDDGGIVIGAGNFSNAGDVLFASGSSLARVGDYVQTSGETIVDGLLDVSGVIDIQGGLFGGGGTIMGDVVNGGAINPGNSPGILHLFDDYQQTGGGILIIEIGGTPSSGAFDQLLIDGDATLAGTLDVRLVDGFLPTVGELFPFLTAASITGGFDDAIVMDGANFALEITGGNAVLQITSAVPLPAGLWLMLAGAMPVFVMRRRLKPATIH